MKVLTFTDKKLAEEYVTQKGVEGYHAAVNDAQQNKGIWKVYIFGKRKEISPKVLESRIRQTVLDLNEEGLYTTDSCAGHKIPKTLNKGYIRFIKKYPHVKVKKALEKHGIKAKVEDYSGVTIADFPMLGGHRKKNIWK